jgi:hypothetical protein
MSLEYLGEKVFLDEIRAAGRIWVLRGAHKNIHAAEIEDGYSLPVWSSQDKAAQFLKIARLIGQTYAPEAVPLEVFIQGWLSDQRMAIRELQLNPDGKTSRVLIVSREEFLAAQGMQPPSNVV